MWAPLPSIRHHLSYDDCLEDEESWLSELFYAVSCNTTVHTDMNSSYRWTEVGWVMFRFCVIFHLYVLS